MSPERVVNLQRKMGEHLDAKVYVWKKAIESNRTTLAFLEEVEDHQVPKLEEDEMEVETSIDLGEDFVKGYATYQPENLENAEKITQNIKKTTGRICIKRHPKKCHRSSERRTPTFVRVSLLVLLEF